MHRRGNQSRRAQPSPALTSPLPPLRSGRPTFLPAARLASSTAPLARSAASSVRRCGRRGSGGWKAGAVGVLGECAHCCSELAPHEAELIGLSMSTPAGPLPARPFPPAGRTRSPHSWRPRPPPGAPRRPRRRRARGGPGSCCPRGPRPEAGKREVGQGFGADGCVPHGCGQRGRRLQGRAALLNMKNWAPSGQHWSLTRCWR